MGGTGMKNGSDTGMPSLDVFATGPDGHSRAVAKLRLENELKQALARDEFELYFQPLVHLEDETLAGFEALIRWNSPLRGPVGPDQAEPEHVGHRARPRIAERQLGPVAERAPAQRRLLDRRPAHLAKHRTVGGEGPRLDPAPAPALALPFEVEAEHDRPLDAERPRSGEQHTLDLLLGSRIGERIRAVRQHPPHDLATVNEAARLGPDPDRFEHRGKPAGGNDAGAAKCAHPADRRLVVLAESGALRSHDARRAHAERLLPAFADPPGSRAQLSDGTYASERRPLRGGFRLQQMQRGHSPVSRTSAGSASSSRLMSAARSRGITRTRPFARTTTRSRTP